jgi:4-amino-4-deoxy-L-arabinose transferase-like glycosyltransferase
VLCGLVTCWATYLLAARLTRDRTTALLAALLLAISNQFLRHARIASYDIYATALITVGLVGLCLMADAGPPAEPPGSPVSLRRRLLIILGTGVSIGLAVLSKGPIPVATVCLPCGLWMLIAGRCRRRALVDIALAAIVSLLVFVPWLLAIAWRHPGAIATWYREILQNSTAVSNNPAQTAADLRRPITYYVLFLVWVFPLTPTFIASLVLPFLPQQVPGAQRERRRPGLRGSLGLVWIITVGGLVLLSLLAEKKVRYALPLFPTAAILTALVWREFLRLPAGRVVDLGSKILLAAQALTLFCIAGIIALAHAATLPAAERLMMAMARHKPRLLDAVSELPDALALGLGVMSPTFWLILALIILLLGLYLWIVQNHRRFHRAALVFTAACWLASLLWVRVYYGVPAFHESPERVPTEALVAATDGRPIYILGYQPWLPVLYYAGRPLPSADPQRLVAGLGSDPTYLLLPEAPLSGPPDKIARPALDAWASLRPMLPSGTQISAVARVNDGHLPLVLYALTLAPAGSATQGAGVPDRSFDSPSAGPIIGSLR